MDNDYVWLRVSAIAREYNKSRNTIYVWIWNGFIFTLGWKLRKDPMGSVRIGIPNEEYSNWKTNPKSIPANSSAKIA